MEQLSKEIAGIKSDINKIFRQQEEMAKLIAENNILLRRNINFYESAQTLFPIDSDEALKKLDADLRTDRQAGIVSVMRKILLGNLMNIDRIIAKSIIMEHNYDGTKEKKSLKSYSNIINGLYEAVKCDGLTYEAFVEKLRTAIRRIKNTSHKQNSRKLKENNI
ncbi:uncharacterized protein LOC142240250 [Haematobia irritans]|uniref:uncharacterized protein LOC142224036 n=1 Tax=Haematobia irritans TaxID=7368 RepID=UPI003F4F5845